MSPHRPINSPISSLPSNRKPPCNTFQGTTKTLRQNVQDLTDEDDYHFLKVKNLHILLFFFFFFLPLKVLQLPEIKYDLTKLSKILSHESTGSAVSRTYMFKLQSSLAKYNSFSLQEGPQPTTYPSSFIQKYRAPCSESSMVHQYTDYFSQKHTLKYFTVLYHLFIDKSILKPHETLTFVLSWLKPVRSKVLTFQSVTG